MQRDGTVETVNWLMWIWDCATASRGATGLSDCAFAKQQLKEVSLGQASCKNRIIRRPEPQATGALTSLAVQAQISPCHRSTKGLQLSPALHCSPACGHGECAQQWCEHWLCYTAEREATSRQVVCFLKRLNPHFCRDLPLAWSSQGLSKTISHSQCCLDRRKVAVCIFQR